MQAKKAPYCWRKQVYPFSAAVECRQKALYAGWRATLQTGECRWLRGL